MKVWSKTKSAVRRGVYALMDVVAPSFWMILMVGAPVVAAIYRHYGGSSTPLVVAIVADLAFVVLWVSFILLFVDDDSSEATVAAIRRGQGLGHAAKLSYDNAMHDDHGSH